MKKLALSLIASAVTIGAASAHSINTGFYLGAALGYGATTAKLQGQNPNSIGSTDFGSGAANVGILGGYGYVTGCLYVGGEISYTFENTKLNTTLNQAPGFSSTQLKRNGYANAALRGGVLVSPGTMGYIRLGLNWSQWKLYDSLNAFNNANPGYGKKNAVSFVPGLGLETAVHKNVYLRVEYDYDFGPNVRATNSALPNNSISASSIRNQSGKIGLAYKF